ncbi:MAG TPA: helix-turn-helix domain-containing protein [Pseudomonadales bacterium]|nr:helix-turn-helix domain-containing protein [Pseudomonadales bacterium]HND14460.1 helix-turn-helix domain-containing protein [Pseudomonadales bacterium]
MTHESDSSTECGPGERLRAARETAGLSVAEVAEELQLLQSFVRALEQNSYERIRGDTFVRGCLRNYARLLGLDPQEIVDAYLQARAHSGPAARPGATKRQRPRGTSGAGRIGVVVTLLAASALYLFYNRAPSTTDHAVVDAVVTVETGAGAQVVPLMVPEHEPQTDTR